MPRLLFSLILSLFLFQIQAQPVKKVLFLGNSYTFSNDLPRMVSNVASSKGDSIFTEISAGGGQRLSNHASDANTYVGFKKNNWDYIVLQEQSQLPSFPIAQVQKDVFPYAKQLCDSIHALPGCTKPVFFMTWGRKNGDQSNCKFYAPLCTYEGMQLELRKNYLTMAIANNAYAAPVGMVWREIRKKWPNIDLYDADESHPKPAGTYAAACTFYAVVFGKSPVGATYKAGLAPGVADSIQMATNSIVFDSLKTWNIIRDTVTPKFTYSNNFDTVQFTYTGSIADSVYWDFGDGNSSKLNSPMHVFGMTDTFQVTLVAYKGCKIGHYDKKIVVRTQPATLNADFNFSASYDTIQFGYTGSQADSFFWSFGNGKMDTGIAPTHVYGVADTFQVQLKAYFKGSKDSVTKQVITTLPVVGIKENKVSNVRFSIFPNPVEKDITITSSSKISKVDILDLNGRIVKSYGNIKDKTLNFSVGFFEEGIYIIQVITPKGIGVQRIVKI